jgi:hypothetical protein
MSHTWTLLIWTAQVVFDVAACVLIAVLWLASRD